MGRSRACVSLSQKGNPLNPLVDVGTKAIVIAAAVAVALWMMDRMLDQAFDNGKLTATIEFKDSLKVLENKMKVASDELVREVTDDLNAKIDERETEVRGFIDERNANREASLLEAIENPQIYERNFACDLLRGMWRAYDQDFNDPRCTGYRTPSGPRESSTDQSP